jgi:hypothetical protein
VARVAAALRFRDRSGLAPLAPQMLRLIAGLLLPLAVVVFFKLRIGGASDLWSQKAAVVLQRLADPGRWIMTAQGLVVVIFTLGRFLISIVPVLALYWYLVRFQVQDERDRTALATGVLALGLTLAIQLLMDILFVENLTVEIGTSFERDVLQLWPAGVFLFFLASGPLQLAAAEKPVPGKKTSKKALKPSRRAAETR